METSLIGITRRVASSNAIDKVKDKKKKRKRRKGRDGKRSASSTSASGSPDSCRNRDRQKSQPASGSQSKNCSESSSRIEAFSGVNECLRWPAHSLYNENLDRPPAYFAGRFPTPGKTEVEEEERIAIYKMNRRKRYLAAQQALIDKYPNTSIYASSSSASSSGRNTTDGISASSSGNHLNAAARDGLPPGGNEDTEAKIHLNSSRLKPGFLIRANSEGNSLKVSTSHIQLTHIPLIPSKSVHSGLGATNFNLAVPQANCSSELALGGSRKLLSKVQ